MAQKQVPTGTATEKPADQASTKKETEGWKPQRVSLKSRKVEQNDPKKQEEKKKAFSVEPIAYSEENLQVAWLEFVGVIKPLKPSLYAAISPYKPLSLGHASIRLTFREEIEASTFSRYLKNAINFFCMKFAVAHFSIEVLVDKNAESTRSVSDYPREEYLEYLKETNPLVAELFSAFKIRLE